MGDLAVSLRDVRVAFESGGKTKAVLDRLNFSVDSEEIVSIVGASGSGKTTLLHTIAGLTEIQSGSIEFPLSHKVGIAFQQANLFPWLSVQENIELGLRYKAQGHLAKKERQEQVLALIDVLRIGDILHQPVVSLSGGQAQRVAIARTLAVHPKLLLLDEPFGALDAGTRHSLQDWILELRDSLKIAIILVTHDLDEALYLGDRVGLLDSQTGNLTFHSNGSGSREDFRTSETRSQLLTHFQRLKEYS